MRCHSPVIDPSVPISHVCLNCMRDAEKSRPDSHLDHATPTFVPTQTVRGKATYSAITHWHGSSKRYESEGRNSLLLNAANIQILTFMQQTDTVQESRASQAPSAQQPFMLQSSCSLDLRGMRCITCTHVCQVAFQTTDTFQIYINVRKFSAYSSFLCSCPGACNAAPAFCSSCTCDDLLLPSVNGPTAEGGLTPALVACTAS